MQRVKTNCASRVVWVRNGCTLSGRDETPQELVALWFLMAPKLAQVGRMGIPSPNLLSKATVQQTLAHWFILGP